MLEERIRYVPVWSGALRALHWLLAAGVAFQLASGWLVQRLAGDPTAWRDWHLMVGQALLLVLAARLALLLFGRGSAGWASFRLTGAVIGGARQTLLFYASLGRAPLPDWYAHNPLWLFLYPLLLLAVLAAVASGLLHDAPYRVAGVSLPALHGAAAGLAGALAAAHVAAVVLHDWKGRGAFVSAMINGNRYFHVRPGPDGAPGPAPRQGVNVTFDRAGRDGKPRP